MFPAAHITDPTLSPIPTRGLILVWSFFLRSRVSDCANPVSFYDSSPQTYRSAHDGDLLMTHCTLHLLAVRKSTGLDCSPRLPFCPLPRQLCSLPPTGMRREIGPPNSFPLLRQSHAFRSPFPFSLFGKEPFLLRDSLFFQGIDTGMHPCP